MSETEREGVPAEGAGREPVLSFAECRFDPESGLLRRDGDEVSLPPKALDTLLCLLERPGRTVPKEELIERVWDGTAVTDHSLTETVRILRNALGDDATNPTYIQTVHRRGYRFIAPVERGRGRQQTAAASAPAPGAAAEGRGPPASSGIRRSLRPTAAALGLAAVAVVALLAWFASSAPDGERGALRTEASAPAPSTPGFVIHSLPDSHFFLRFADPVITPDGSKLFYSSTFSTTGRVYEHPLDGGEAMPVPASAREAFLSPFVSPDGTQLGYFAPRGALRILSLSEGTTTTLCDPCAKPIGMASFAGGTWAPDGTIVFAHGRLMRVSATGGASQAPVTLPSGVLDEHGGIYLWPHFLPGGEWLLATHRTGPTIHGAQVYLINSETGEERGVLRDGTGVRYVETGHLLFVREGNLWAVVFDLETLKAVGDPVRVLDGIATWKAIGEAQFTVSDTGTLAYLPGPFHSTHSYRLLSADRDGDSSSLLEDREDFDQVRLSPEGSRLAVSVFNGPDRDIRIYDLASRTHSTITRPVTDETWPVWHPNGDRIAFQATQKDAPPALLVARTDGGLVFSPKRASVEADWLMPNSWSPDGETIVYTLRMPGRTDNDLWALDLESGKPRPLAQTELDEGFAAFSPDGRWLAYARGDHIVLSAYPGGEPTEVVAPWGMSLRWSTRPNGLFELLYAYNSIWRLPISTDPAGDRDLRIGEAERLPVQTYRGNDWDISADGERLVLVDTTMYPVRSEEIVVIPDWLEELERLLPGGR